MRPREVEPRIIRLLLKALESLEPQERAEVLETLLARALSRPDLPQFAPIHAPADSQTARLAFTVPMGQALRAADLRMFPVRLPERDHRRLKAWCETHDFPMAVVVRGLIERFLDHQEEPSAE